MSEVAAKIQELEVFKKDCKQTAEFADAIVRLQDNPDFRKVINEGFFLHQAARYAQESGDPMLTAVQRQDALNIAQASGHLKRFLSVSVQMGNEADRSIANADEQIEQLRSEA